MHKPVLYFLRSSEQKIATDILYYAMELDKTTKTLQDFPKLDIYNRYYGLSPKDIGLYALQNQTIAGAVWVRPYKPQDGVNGFVDENTPILVMALKPDFRSRGIGSAMLEQFLVEVSAVYEQISLSVLKDSNALKFFKKFGFTEVEASEGKSIIDGSRTITMIKKLIKQEIVRPTDGYDPRKWMD